MNKYCAPDTQKYGRFPDSPLTYFGGKKRLVDTIIPKIPSHKIYCEPYFGGGAIFFAKEPSYLEAINDVNANLINFYKQIQTNFKSLQKQIQTTLYSETLYNESLLIYHGQKKASNIQKAVATFVVFNQSRMATPERGWVFDNGTGGSHKAVVYHHKVKNFSAWLQKRLEYVQISCHDALQVIQERDSVDSFFYIDPPYIGAYQGHYSGFTIVHLLQLISVLEHIQGKFLLSNYHFEHDEEICSRNNWVLEEISVPRTINNGKKPNGRKEILIRNFQVKSPVLQLKLF